MQTERTTLSGIYIIEARDAVTGSLIRTWSFYNQLTNINRDIRTAMLLGSTTGYSLDTLAIRYFAFGTGTTPASASDTLLQVELFRKAVTKISKVNDSTVQSIVSLSPDECNFTIREIGVFCSPGAGASANSGFLLSRVNVNIVKNSNMTLNIVRQDIVTI